MHLLGVAVIPGSRQLVATRSLGSPSLAFATGDYHKSTTQVRWVEWWEGQVGCGRVGWVSGVRGGGVGGVGVGGWDAVGGVGEIG